MLKKKRWLSSLGKIIQKKIKNHIYSIVPKYTCDINESINNPRKYLSLIASDINKDFSSLKRINHSFPAFYDANSEILILGSFPSVQSRIDGFYYMHKGNRFYKVLSKVLNVLLMDRVIVQ